MEMKRLFELFIILAVASRSSFICAENSDEKSKNDTTTYKTTTTTIYENVTETLENKQRDSIVNVSNAEDAMIKIHGPGLVETEVKTSDEIIISNYKDYDSENTEEPTFGSNNDNTASDLQTGNLRTTPKDIQSTRSRDAIISVRKLSTKTNIQTTSLPELITKFTSKPTPKNPRKSSVISTTTDGTTVILNTSQRTLSKGRSSLIPEINDKSPSSGTTPVVPHEHHAGTSHAHKDGDLHKMHHIPFRHHLQLVPMDDEPFGAALLKDQRYIVSVLIPVGVGIVGALVIMVTVYGLRHVAKKHGREFPRVDIEAGRQNIASISSERTDKMLLLDDDEDNEF